MISDDETDPKRLLHEQQRDTTSSLQLNTSQVQMSHVSHDADHTSRETDHVTTANNRDPVARTTTDLHEHDQRLQRNLNSVSINQRTAAIVAPGALKSPSPQSWPLVTHPTHAVHQSLPARHFTTSQHSDHDRSNHLISSQAVHLVLKSWQWYTVGTCDSPVPVVTA